MKYSVVLDIFGIAMCLPKSLFPDSATVCSIMDIVSEAGYSAVEFFDWADKDLDMYESNLKRLNLKVVSLFSKNKGNLADPNTHENIIQGFIETIPVAKRFGSDNILVLTGKELPLVPRDVQHNNIASLLKRIAVHAEAAGVTAIIEPISDFFPVPQPPEALREVFRKSRESFNVIREVGSPNVKLLFDIFHHQFMEGNVLNNLLPNLELVGHIHLANNPSRTDITIGELDYSYILQAIADAGYDGYIGLEYFAFRGNRNRRIEDITMEDKKQSLIEAHKILI